MPNVFTVLLILTFYPFALKALEAPVITTVRVNPNEVAFHVNDEPSVVFVDQMFKTYSDEKRRDYTHLFRHVAVEGISAKLRVTIYEGVYGQAPEGYSYFNTFTSEKYRQGRIERMKPGEGFGIIIYIRKSGRQFINYGPEEQAFRHFIESLIAA